MITVYRAFKNTMIKRDKSAAGAVYFNIDGPPAVAAEPGHAVPHRLRVRTPSGTCRRRQGGGPLPLPCQSPELLSPFGPGPLTQGSHEIRGQQGESDCYQPRASMWAAFCSLPREGVRHLVSVNADMGRHPLQGDVDPRTLEAPQRPTEREVEA